MADSAAADRHLAELNVGRLVGPTDDPRLADFMANLERVNALAERSPGFVWRLKGEDEAKGATDFTMPSDPTMAVNLSVWESAEALETFVWKTVHKRFYTRKAEWFTPMERPHFVMWWVAPGHRPTLDEAQAKLDHLTAHGPSEVAFGWEDLPNVKAWREARCA